MEKNKTDLEQNKENQFINGQEMVCWLTQLNLEHIVSLLILNQEAESSQEKQNSSRFFTRGLA